MPDGFSYSCDTALLQNKAAENQSRKDQNKRIMFLRTWPRESSPAQSAHLKEIRYDEVEGCPFKSPWQMSAVGENNNNIWIQCSLSIISTNARWLLFAISRRGGAAQQAENNDADLAFKVSTEDFWKFSERRSPTVLPPTDQKTWRHSLPICFSLFSHLFSCTWGWDLVHQWAWDGGSGRLDRPTVLVF